jgi:hypothetical protein
VPLGFAPSRSVKVLVKKRFEYLLGQLNASAMSEGAQQAVRTFCKRLLEKPHGGRRRPVKPQQVRRELTKSTTAPDAIIEEVSTGRRPNLSLTGFLAVDEALKGESQHRDARYSINNSASPSLIRELALLFVSQGDYSWFNKNWLLLHEEFLTDPDVHWEFLAGVAMEARLSSPGTVQDMTFAITAFRESLRDRIRRKQAERLFDNETEYPAFERRCQSLLDVLT